MGNNGWRDLFKTKVDCAPKIVPVDDMMINKKSVTNCANFYFSNSKYRVEESFSAKVNGVTFQIFSGGFAPRPRSWSVQVEKNIGKVPKRASSRE